MVGLHNVNGTNGSQTRDVDQIIIHPQYSGNSLNNDYALLRLSSPITDFEPIQLCTDTAHDEVINDDGISHMVEGGLALKIQYEMLGNSSCRIFAKIS